MQRFLLYSRRNHSKNPFIKDIVSFYLEKKDFLLTVAHKKLSMNISLC